MNVIVTRPEPGLSRTADRLSKAGYRPFRLPMTEIVPLPEGVAAAGNATADAFVATSAAAVDAAAHVLDRHKPIFVVGEATAAAARTAGFSSVERGPGDGAGLAGMISRSRLAGASLVYLAGRVRSQALEDPLRGLGAVLTVAEVYDARIVAHAPETTRRLAELEAPRAALVYSARAGRLLCALLSSMGEPFDGPLDCLCIGESAGKGLAGEGLVSVHVAARADEESLFSLLSEIRNRRRPDSV